MGTAWSWSTAKPNIYRMKLMCVRWDQLGVLFYDLVKPSESITGVLLVT